MKILPPVSIEARRLLPSKWDLLAAILVMGFLVAFADVSRFLVHPLSSISGDYLKLNPWDLPGYALRTSLLHADHAQGLPGLYLQLCHLGREECTGRNLAVCTAAGHPAVHPDPYPSCR